VRNIDRANKTRVIFTQGTEKTQKITWSELILYTEKSQGISGGEASDFDLHGNALLLICIKILEL
jgi:hypothetical protein